MMVYVSPDSPTIIPAKGEEGVRIACVAPSEAAWLAS